MNNLIVLAIIAIVLAALVYRKTRGEVMSCAFVAMASMSVSAVLLYFQSLAWKIELNNTTLMLLIAGMFSLCMAELVAQRRHRKRATQVVLCYGTYDFKFCNFLILLYVVFTLLYALEIRRLGTMIGYNDLNAIGEVKANIDEMSGNMNPIVRQMYKVVTAASYIHALIFVHNNFLAKSTWLKEAKHLIPFLCTIIISLASGGRLNIYKVLIGFVFIGYMIIRESGQWEKLYIDKILKIGLPLMFLFFFLFSAVGTIVKESADNRAEIETIKYISYYAGSPIQVFNLKVEAGRRRWAYDRFGNYTFSGIYQLLQVKKDAKAERIGAGMLYLGGFSDTAGNAQTLFGAAYFDFGTFGMIVFLFISYFVFSKYYYKLVLNTYSSYKRNRNLLTYTYCYVSIIALAFYDSCYWILLSTTGLLTLLVLLIMYWIYFKKLLIVNTKR